jgi:dTDP-4-amino-4,6-dideoxygalactose transaminase
MGPEVAELESALAAFVGCSEAIAVSSGTDALRMVLMEQGVGPGDAVFVPSFTFTASAEVVVLAGATPVFVDVDARSFNVDVDHLREQIESVARAGELEPRAILAVDLFGLPADYERIHAVAAERGLFVLADAAQSFGARVGDRQVGTLAPVTATSFYPAKPLGAYGDGGALFTDDPTCAEELRSIRAHGEGESRDDAVRIGVNGRLDTLQAAILLAKLPIFRDELEARESLARYYDARLGGKITTPLRPEELEDRSSSWAQYSILLENRDEVAASLKSQGMPFAIYYPLPIHLQRAYQRFGGGKGSLPVCEALCAQVLSLPMHAYMDEEGAERVCQAVERATR